MIGSLWLISPLCLWPPPSQKVTFFFLYLKIDAAKVYLSINKENINKYYLYAMKKGDPKVAFFRQLDAVI
jgi:hypothetical protein